MTILNNTDMLQPLSKDELLKRKKNAIASISSEAFKNLVRTQGIGIDMLWKDSKLTPQEIIDYLGEDAIKIFQFHGALTEFIAAIAQLDGSTVDLKLPTKAFTVVDGKITVLEEPYQP